jgi:hypothetical protein
MNNKTQLPPFLRRRDGRLELALHATGVQQFKVCPLKFWLTRGLEIERAVPKWNLNYGGAIHAALAYRYSHLGEPLKEVGAAQVALLTDWFVKCLVDDAEWRTLARAVQAVEAYNAAYPAHEWNVLGVEENFSVYVGTITTVEGDLVDCRLDGRKDLVVAWHNGIWVVDHKTASEWGDDPTTNQELLSGRRSFQFRSYAWAEREAQRARADARLKNTNATVNERDVLPVRGVVGNYIVGRKPFSEADAAVKRRAGKGKPRDEHHVEFFTFSDAVLDEWREQFLMVASRVLRSWQSSEWEQSFDRGCAYYGKCEFYEFCEGEVTLDSAFFRKREPQPSATVNEETL